MMQATRRPGIRKLHEKLMQQLLGPLLLAGGIFYLTFHLLSGERGVYALLKEERKLDIVTGELVEITAKRKALDHDVRLMSAGSLDLDLLDEQSRAVLNNAGPDELVVPMPTADPASAAHSQ